ncbi:MAG: S-layer homology domain-containing protein [Thermoleophilia bacterium]
MLLSVLISRAGIARSVGLFALVVTAVAVSLSLAPSAQARTAGFVDVPSSHAYHVQIETMAQLGVLEGYNDGTFRPDDPVTRQQFAKMAVEAMRIAVSEADVCSFIDVQRSGADSLYPDNYVAAAQREKLVIGYVGAKGPIFKPTAPITLAQVITIATRGALSPLVVPPASYKSAWGVFDPSHGVVARVAQYNGLLRDLAPAGTRIGSMSPWAKATRGQAAAVLFNVMGTDPAGMNGRFLGDSTDLVDMFRARGKGDGRFTVSLTTLAKLYVTYGERFGIRADMAWAQMIHETGYGQFGGDVMPEQNNMAGIGAIGGGVPGHSFATAELGVIAQYVHLAWYLYPKHMSDPYCVMVQQPVDGPITTPGDPRHFGQPDGSVHRGNVRTVFDLSGKWAPGSEYGSKIQGYAAAIVRSVGLW